jgi:hypothetical protein
MQRCWAFLLAPFLLLTALETVKVFGSGGPNGISFVQVPGDQSEVPVSFQYDDAELAKVAEEMLGTVTFESNRPVGAPTLRQNDGPARIFQSEVPVFTTFPVVPGEKTKNPAEDCSDSGERR